MKNNHSHPDESNSIKSILHGLAIVSSSGLMLSVRTVLIIIMAAILQITAVIPAMGQRTDTLRLIDELFAGYHNEMPGLAVAISSNGKTIYSKAFGIANLEHMVPNTTSTIFECGSVSKQFVAASILLLVQDGKLSLEDDIRKYVPELPQYDAVITIQHLLSHTSGLKDWGSVYAMTGWPRTTRVYTQELGFDIVFRQKSLNFLPGSEYSYSNSNYVMLVLITERVSGKLLAEFTTERLFEPLGMDNTRWRDNFREVVPGRAIAYSGREGMFLQNMPFENLHGPGGLLSTTADLLLWNRLLETHELFSDHIANLRIESGKLNNGRPAGYAAGLMIGKWNGFDEISHSGSTAGYKAWLAWYPEKELSVAILSNYASFNPTATGRDIAAIFMGRAPVRERQSPPKTTVRYTPDTDMKEYSGTYYSEDVDVTYNIELRDSNLHVSRKAGDTFRLNATSKDEFSTVSNGSFKFVRDRRGKITGFTISVTRARNVPFNKK